jgi:hypothetical protein
MKMEEIINKAKELPSIANLLAISTFVPLLKGFPVLNKVDPKTWDYFVTIACIQMGLTSFEILKIPDKEKDQLRLIMTKSATAIYSDAIKANEQCFHFVKTNVDGKILDDSLLGRYLGLWIVLNLFGKSQSIKVDEAMKIATIIGETIVNEFKSYWY